MPAKWDEAAYKKLLFAVIHVEPPKASQYQAIADLMGEGTTANGLRQALQKMKKEAVAQFAERAAEDEDTPAPKTPAKRGSAKTAGSKRKKKAAVEEDGDDEEARVSPSKKVKMEAKDEDEEDDLV